MKQLEQAITTVEIAEMTNTEHSKILRKLEGDKDRKGYIQILTDSHLGVSNYFQESTYKDSSGKENRCYKVTKLGCDFLANKFTGEKGVIFTAKYVKRFRDMEEVIQEKIPTGENLIALAVIEAQKLLSEKEEKIVQLEAVVSEMKPKANYVDSILQSKGTVTTTQIAQDYGMTAIRFNKLLNQYHIQRKVGKQWILYAEYQGNGFVHSHTIGITRSDGRPDVTMNTEWTQKGRLFLYNFLKEKNIYPLIEMEDCINEEVACN